VAYIIINGTVPSPEVTNSYFTSVVDLARDKVDGFLLIYAFFQKFKSPSYIPSKQLIAQFFNYVSRHFIFFNYLHVGLFLYQIKFLNETFPVYYLLFMKIHNHERLEFVQHESSLLCLCLNRFWDFSFLATRTAINIPEQNKYGFVRVFLSLGSL